MSRTLVVLALLWSFVAPRDARGEQPLEVLIIDGGSSELARKVRAEVLYAGFAALAADDDPRLGAADGASARALASIRIASEHRIDLHVAQAGEASVYTQAFVRRPGEGDSFALRVVEQLRARLIGAGSQTPGVAPGTSEKATLDTPDAAALKPPSAAPITPGAGATTLPGAAVITPPRSAPSLASSAADGPLPAARDAATSLALPDAGELAAARVPTLWLDAGVGASWAVGGLGGTAHGVLGVRLDLGSAWGASLTSLYPLTASQLAASEGEARVSWYMLAAGLDYSLPWPAPWMASAGLGAGLMALDVQGEGRDAFVGQRDRLLASAYHLELCAGRQLTSWLRLRARLLTGVNAPRPVLRFDEREVASLGRWFGSLGLSFDVGVPLSTGRTR